MIQHESSKYLNVIKHLLEYSSKMKSLVSQYVLESKQHLRKTSLLNDTTEMKYIVYYPQIENALEEFKVSKKIPDILKKKSKSILESRSFEMNFLPALLEYQPKDRSLFTDDKLNFIKELLIEGLIPSSTSEKFELLISKSIEEDELDYCSERNELLSSMEFFSQNISQSNSSQLKDQILYISQKIKKFLKNHSNSKDELKKLVQQIFNELSNSLYKDIQVNNRIRDWVEFSMKELFESNHSLHEFLFEVISELMEKLDDLNIFQKRTLSLYLCYLCSGDGSSSLNLIGERLFEYLSCNETNQLSIIEFLNFYLSECLNFDEIVTNNWSQKFILNDVRHKKCCYIPEICLQKINFFLENLNNFRDIEQRNQFKSLTKNIQLILKQTSNFNLSQWIKCELTFNISHQISYFKEKLISFYLSEYNFSISELTRKTFEYFVEHSTQIDIKNQNANFLLLSAFMIYFEMNNEQTDSIWILDNIESCLKTQLIKKNRFHQIFDVLNSIYPHILFIDVKSKDESTWILERIFKFIQDFKVFYPFSESFISLILQGIYHLNTKKSIIFDSSYLMEQFEINPLFFVNIVKSWNKHSNLFRMMNGDSLKEIRIHFENITTIFEEFGIK